MGESATLAAPTLTPLRYPGGKSRLANYLGQIINAQVNPPSIYVEPFAGGAGAAFELLKNNVVDHVLINDLNPGIAAFWRSVFYDTDQLADLVRSQPPTMDLWYASKDAYLTSGQVSDLELGYATFFLNRTNRSGILHAGPIGGKNQQGKWKLDARFSRFDLADRIEALGRFRTRVTIEEMDATELLRGIESEREHCFIYVDPPYIVNGSDLYLNQLRLADHQVLAESLLTGQFKWLLTYDADGIVYEKLYPLSRCIEFNISHTAQTQHIGTELMLFSDNLIVPHLNILPRARATWLRGESTND